MSATPVGYLYTPQQLMGSVSYGSGVLLGNWREDDALDEKRLMDYVGNRDTGNLVLLKQKQKLKPQLAPAALSKTSADGVMRSGDVVMLQSGCNGGALAVSLGQVDVTEMEQGEGAHYSVYCNDASAPVARNTIKILPFNGAADGSPLAYGQKLMLCFSSSLDVQGVLASCPTLRSGLSTQLINKQECFMQAVDADVYLSFDCAWEIQPVDVDARVAVQGQPIRAGEPFVVVHCHTNRRLAGLQIVMPNDFGMESAVCCHTFVQMGKVNKLMRETIGRPSSNFISRSEESENVWYAVYA